MGNHKFRLSDMIPNAWFYKLRDMGRKTRTSSKKKTQNQTSSTSGFRNPNVSQPRQSYYYTRDSGAKGYKLYNSPANTKSSGNSHFLDPPRRSSRRRSRRKTIYRPSPALCTCGGGEGDWYLDRDGWSPLAEFDDLLKSPTSEFDSDAGDLPQSFNGLASWSSSFSSSATDIVLDMNEKSRTEELAISELDLRPILTKLPAGNSRNSDAVDEEGSTMKESRPRKSFSQSTGVKLRVNSPKIGSRKIQSHARKSVSSSGKRSKAAAAAKKKSFSGSFAVVKASLDPEKDFKESMMEMIVENNIKSSKDLEDLLACYLSLNSDEYHALIIKAFQHIWFNLSHLHF
ncbi:PREDICTED: transcription repressor OFP1-like isoform X2 [Ipomoea nil]|uniref:transcription repressor OFP1-like isoform X2 n=1 Tax=Ipomoea nil TaxID=35883 RepID=UPI000901042D|nr:PREDICTED: transcription repressor OFP1-like isoform X2 [Ipomoea nil]